MFDLGSGDDFEVESIKTVSLYGDHNKLNASARHICQQVFGSDYDAFDVSDWPHIASYYIAKKLSEASPDSDEARVVIAALQELMAPYSSWKQRRDAGFNTERQP